MTDYQVEYPPIIPVSNSVNFGNMDPNFLNPLTQLANDFYSAYGRPLHIADAWRSTETQAKAYNDWMAGRKQVPVVAKPGTSRHESGQYGAQAVDVAREDVPLINQMPLQNYGLETGAGWRRSEPWHLQLSNINQQLAYYHQMNQGRKRAQPEEQYTVEYIDQLQPESGGWFPTLGDISQAWTGLKEGAKGIIPKYGAFVSGSPESTYQEEYQKWKEAMGPAAPTPESWWGKVFSGLGSAGAIIPEFMALNAIMPGLGTSGTIGRMTQSALPFAASSILNPEAGMGDLAHSLAMGAGLGAIPPTWGRLARGLGGAGVGGGLGYLSSRDAKQASADAAVLGILSALHGRVPQEYNIDVNAPEFQALVPSRIIQPWERTEMAPPGAGPDMGWPGGSRMQPRLLPQVSDTIYPEYQEVPAQVPLLPGMQARLPEPQRRLTWAGETLPDTAGLRKGPLPGQMPERLAQPPVPYPSQEKIVAPGPSGEVTEPTPAAKDPWEMTASQYQDAARVHAPWIAEISPAQYASLSKRGKAQYDAKRAQEWQASSDIKAEWRSKIKEAWENGSINFKTPNLSEDAKRLIAVFDRDKKIETDKQAQQKVLTDRIIKSASELKVGDIVDSPMYGKGLKVVKVNPKSVTIEGTFGRVNVTPKEKPIILLRPETPEVLKDYPELEKSVESTEISVVPPLSPKAVQIKRTFPDISDGQAELLAKDPKLLKQFTKGNWEAIARVSAQGKTSDLGAQRALPGAGGGLFDDGFKEPGPTPDSLRAGLSLDDFKFLGRKMVELGNWVTKQFDKDTRFKYADIKGQTEAKGTPRDIHLGLSDLGIWRKFWDMPEWLQKEYPQFLNVAINDWRQKLYNNLKNPWFKEMRPVFTLPRQQWDSLKNLIVEADQLSRRMLKQYGVNRDQIDQAVNNLKAQYSPEVQQAAESWWRTGSRIWSTIDDIYSKMGMTTTELDQLRREMGYVPYYFPHMRFGKYMVTVRQGDQTLHAEGATNRLTRDRLMADLKKQYPDARVSSFETKGIAEEVFFGLNDAHAAQLAKAALSKAGKLTPDVEQKVMQALADSLKERGFGRQFIQQKNIPGFETDDFHRVLTNYISGAAGFISKLKAAPEHVKALGAIDAKMQPRLYSYAEKYVRHSLQNASRVDEIAGKLRGLMFHYFLGFNPKSAVLNLTQNIATGAPVLSTLKVKNPGMKILGAVKDLVKDGKAYWEIMHGREGEFKTLKDNEVRALKTAFNNGWLDDVFTEEMMGMVGSRLGQGMNKFEKASHFLFGQAESLNRAGMFLASFRELNKKGIPFDTAINKANDLTKMSHFAYGKYNLPESVRDLGPLGRTIYTFRSFSHNYALLLRNLAKNDPAAFGRAIRNLALLGGLKAVPLVGAAFGIYKALTGQDLWQEAAQDKDNNLPYTLARFGVPGMAGIDMSGSVSIEIMKDLKQWSDIPKELLGAVGGLGENLANAADSYKRGDYYRATEDLSPQAVRNVLGAYRKGTEGVTTRTGRQVFDAQGQPVKLTPREAVEKGLGFQPTRTTIQREINDYLYEMRQNQQNRGDKWATRLINAVRNGDQSTMNQVLQEVMDYNQKAVQRGEPPIDMDAYMKRRMQPQLPGPKKWLPYYQQLQ